jgi:hypothetical protein
VVIRFVGAGLLGVVAYLGPLGCKAVNRDPSDPCTATGSNPCTEQHRNVCVNEDGNARCLCNAGFIARPSGVCEEVSSINCPSHAGDSAEPDDCMSRAKQLAPGDDPRSQTIEPVGDYDFFTFEGTARHVYIVTVTSTGSLLPRIDAFDQGGVWLGADERTGTAQLALKARATAPLLARISQSPIDPSVASGGYTISLGTTGLEDYGDVPADASSITATPSGQAPSTTYGKFEFPADEDWFVFSGVSGQYYRLTFDSAYALPYVSLYLASDLNAPLWTARQPITDFDLPANGTVYLALYPPPEGGGSYGFTLTR